MQASNKPFYDLRSYGNDGSLMLVRIKDNEHKSSGIPPTVSQTLFINESEIEQLMKVLQNYVNTKRDS